jgi:hypothetical protein
VERREARAAIAAAEAQLAKENVNRQELLLQFAGYLSAAMPEFGVFDVADMSKHVNAFLTSAEARPALLTHDDTVAWAVYQDERLAYVVADAEYIARIKKAQASGIKVVDLVAKPALPTPEQIEHIKRLAKAWVQTECEVDQPFEWRANWTEHAKKEAEKARTAFCAALDALVKEKT